MIRKSPVRTGVYPPPAKTLPYLAIVITPEGKQRIRAFPTRELAEAYTEKASSGYLTRFSKVGHVPKLRTKKTAPKKPKSKKAATKTTKQAKAKKKR